MSECAKLSSLPYRWVILLIMWSTMCVALIAQFQVAALAYQIIPDFKLTSGQYGMVLTAPMLAGLFFSFPAGALADRWGVKRVVAVGFVFSIVGTFFRFSAENFLQLFILMFLAGICPGFLNANAPKLLGAWFSKAQMGMAMGIYFSATGVGMGIALATTALFPSTKSAFIAAGIAMLVIWLLWMLFIKAKPEGAPDLPVMPVTKYIGVAAGSKNVWLVGVALMFFMGSSMAFSGFLPNALHSEQGLRPAAAGFMASIVTFGTVVGSILGPVISRRTGKLRPFLALVAVLGAAAGILAWLAPQGIVMPALFALLGIMLGMCAPILMSFPMLLPEIGPVYAGSAGGIIGTLQVVGGVCIPSFIITPLAGQNYTLFFALGSLCFFLVSVVVLLLPELGAKSQAKVGADLAEAM
ncbi:MFS transporter [Desulfoscipio gibsoniae]|uniref:Nitrate/nitrite transporter n=1 Tax=Desulfoscipio gibsoniae DSM 7213 TaxID=767817 RepID=R4KI82_9FIRM|nr:MFS transporter [Desulfoscipio gibsoniae]AGL00235.1 nitrate/nitrite transporter [Desulfoscipio gibsoniae DSM 7213]